MIVKHKAAAKVEQQLALEESALHERLMTELPLAEQRGHDLFTNSEFNPHGLHLAHLSGASEELLASARQCIAWREAIGAPVEGSVGWLFLAGCQERAANAPHSRGPKKLASWLLKALQPSASSD